MKMKMYFLFNLIIIFMLSSIESSPVSEVYKVILSQNLKDIGVKSLQLYNIYLIMNLKGLSITIDNNSEQSLMPMSLFEQISSFYRETYPNVCFFQTKRINDGLELTLDGECMKLETVHYILKDRGISIPITELFKKNGGNAYYSFAFVGNDSVDKIIFGKNLIEKMQIEFIDGDNDYIIRNQDFVAKVEDK